MDHISTVSILETNYMALSILHQREIKIAPRNTRGADTIHGTISQSTTAVEYYDITIIPSSAVPGYIRGLVQDCSISSALAMGKYCSLAMGHRNETRSKSAPCLSMF